MDDTKISIRNSFQTLPTEVRHLILDYTIPIRRLAVQPVVDPEWSLSCLEGRELPAVIFIKELHKQAIAIFYGKAILEVACMRPPDYCINDFLKWKRAFDINIALSRIFSFCPSSNLASVTQVKIFSDHTKAVNAESYEATLKWLIENTGVQNVSLSQRMMTRLRAARIDVDRACQVAASLCGSPVRIVRVYRHHPQTQWETLQRSKIQKIPVGEQLPQLQIHALQLDSSNDLILDPRWDARKGDNLDELGNCAKAGKYFDMLVDEHQVGRNTEGKETASNSASAKSLCQICFVSKHSA